MRERLRELRTKLKLTQTEFGRKLGVSRSVIANFELGRVKLNDIFIGHISEIFGMNISWLTNGEGEMFAPGEEYDPTFETLWLLYKRLKPNFKDYLLNQIAELVKLQDGDSV